MDPDRRMLQAAVKPPSHHSDRRPPSLSVRAMVSITKALAYKLDSLVRVTRREGRPHHSPASAIVAVPSRSASPPSTYRSTGTRPATQTPCSTAHFRVAQRLRSPGLSGQALPRHRARMTPDNPRWQLDLSTGSETPSSAQQKVAPSTPYLATMSGTCNSFCKVLFILRSHYLCAIGLGPIFSFGRDIPADSRCSPNQHYSVRGWQPRSERGRDGGFTLLAGLSRKLRPRLIAGTARPNTLQLDNRKVDDSALSCSPLARRYDGNRSCCLFLG